MWLERVEIGSGFSVAGIIVIAPNLGGNPKL